MKKKTVPKRMVNLLKKRVKLSNELNGVCKEIDNYCKEIGVDFNDPDVCLQTDIRIYCETDAGMGSTLRVIKKTLGVAEE